jgi:hypothetical protein
MSLLADATVAIPEIAVDPAPTRDMVPIVRAVVLDLAVNFASERGLLGIALHPDFPTDPGVYLYWTESSTGADTGVLSETPLWAIGWIALYGTARLWRSARTSFRLRPIHANFPAAAREVEPDQVTAAPAPTCRVLDRSALASSSRSGASASEGTSASSAPRYQQR